MSQPKHWYKCFFVGVDGQQGDCNRIAGDYHYHDKCDNEPWHRAILYGKTRHQNIMNAWILPILRVGGLDTGDPLGHDPTGAVGGPLQTQC